MKTSQLESYAPQARHDFMAAIAKSAQLLGISAAGFLPLEILGADFKIAGSNKIYPAKYRGAYEQLKAAITAHGYAHVIEQVAYTWFNRILAIRYMEVNNYFKHGKRVLSNIDRNEHRPQILVEAHTLNNQLPNLPAQEVIKLIENNQFDQLYSQILLAQSQQLHHWMPQIFSPIDDYTALLLPTDLLATDSLIAKLLSAIDEESFKQVEVIGWLYQYYISDKKTASMARVGKQKGGYTSNEVPSVTQLFTPNWIVKYMLQNSLGATWFQANPASNIKSQLEYYIEPASQSAEVSAQLAAINPGYLDPTTLTVLDPACGSGHILVEAYQLLKQIYLEEGYPLQQIPHLILKHNLFGLEIDQRATQLATFALIMQARADDANLFDQSIQTNIVQIVASNHLDAQAVFTNLAEKSNFITFGEVRQFIEIFTNADLFGSLIQISPNTLEIAHKLESFIDGQSQQHNDLLQTNDLEQLRPLIQQTKLLAQTYACVVANPPYMGSAFFNDSLGKFITQNYTRSKSDLCVAFMERGLTLTEPNGLMAMINLQSWMFLSSYKDFRIWLLDNATIHSFVHNGRGVWGSDFASCDFVIKNTKFINYIANYKKLFDRNGEVNSNEAMSARAKLPTSILAPQGKFAKLPGSPIAYWVSDKVADIFATYPPLSEFADARQGLATADNNRFLRLWHEVDYHNIGLDMANREQAQQSGLKWFPYNKGGEFRKWYGNQDCVVNWQNDGAEIKNFVDDKGKQRSRPQNTEFYFREGVTWTLLSSSYFGVRYSPTGSIFDVNGMTAFSKFDEVESLSLVAFMSSCLSSAFLAIINPTLAFQAGNIAAIPTKLVPACEPIVKELIDISKADWDSFETSWNFVRNPLVGLTAQSLAERYAALREIWRTNTARMKALEEENNRLHIEAYDLADEFSPAVEDRLVTLSCNPQYRYKSGEKEFAVADLEARLQLETYQELISYAIGCVFGRYSLDYDGLAYAGGAWESSRYTSFIPSGKNVLPLTDTMFFADDGARRIEEFIQTVFAADQTTSFYQLAQIIKPNNRDNSLKIINDYLCNDFYKDHLKRYQKKPIYWLFSSGKHKAFQALVYLQRLDTSTIANLRTEYIRPLLSFYENSLAELRELATPSKDQSKSITLLDKKIDELRDYDQRVEHLINQNIVLDLDDGVTLNYAKFGDVLEKIK